mmetsp:Transcript_45944/g.128087  ORF Transcript_45944/g.128087 Transcript_45944/m.128087 type:complete len:212 (+) Transcript_45944:572-1207(+)
MREIARGLGDAGTQGGAPRHAASGGARGVVDASEFQVCMARRPRACRGPPCDQLALGRLVRPQGGPLRRGALSGRGCPAQGRDLAHRSAEGCGQRGLVELRGEIAVRRGARARDPGPRIPEGQRGPGSRRGRAASVATPLWPFRGPCEFGGRAGCDERTRRCTKADGRGHQRSIRLPMREFGDSFRDSRYQCKSLDARVAPHSTSQTYCGA